MLGNIYYFNMENSSEIIKLNNKVFHLHYFYLLQIAKKLEDLFCRHREYFIHFHSIKD